MLRLPLLPAWTRWALVALVALLVVTFSIVPLPTQVTSFGPLGLFPIRQYLHLIAYAGFAGVLGYALVDSPRPDWQVLAVAFALAVGFGGAMELLQLTLPHRHFSVRDFGMNAAGAAVAVVSWRLVLRRSRFYRVAPSVPVP